MFAKHGCHRRQQSQNRAKYQNLKVLQFDPARSQGHVKMNLQSKFGYCMTTQTLFISGTALRTDGQTKGTEGRSHY